MPINETEAEQIRAIEDQQATREQQIKDLIELITVTQHDLFTYYDEVDDVYRCCGCHEAAPDQHDPDCKVKAVVDLALQLDQED